MIEINKVKLFRKLGKPDNFDLTKRSLRIYNPTKREVQKPGEAKDQ